MEVEEGTSGGIGFARRNGGESNPLEWKPSKCTGRREKRDKLI